MSSEFISSALHQLKQYKMLGEEVLLRIPESYINWKYNHDNNSIAAIVKHMTNDMCLQRNVLVAPIIRNETPQHSQALAKLQLNRAEVLEIWNQGWECLFHTLQEMDKNHESDFTTKTNSSTNQLIQQLAHYPFHIGQIIYIEKMIRHQQHFQKLPENEHYFIPQIIQIPQTENFLSRENIEDEPGNDTIL